MAPGDHDLLIEIRTIVRQLLDRMSGHDQRFDAIEARVGTNEAQILVLQNARQTERDTDERHVSERRHQDSSKLAFWTAVGSVGLTLVTALTLIIALTRGGTG